MTGAAFLLLALALCVAAGDWVAVHREAKALEYLCKPLTMVVLIGATLALDADDSAVQTWFVVALVLCLLGDVFLMLPQDLFVFGLGAFLLGHVAYIVGMQVDGVDVEGLGIGLAVVALAVSVIGLQVLRAVQRNEAELFVPVVAYMVVISAMVVSAVGVGHPAGIIGAALFYASDSLIAWNRFIGETRNGRLAIMTTYHLAQVGLVLSLV